MGESGPRGNRCPSDADCANARSPRRVGRGKGGAMGSEGVPGARGVGWGVGWVWAWECRVGLERVVAGG